MNWLICLKPTIPFHTHPTTSAFRRNNQVQFGPEHYPKEDQRKIFYARPTNQINEGQFEDVDLHVLTKKRYSRGDNIKNQQGPSCINHDLKTSLDFFKGDHQDKTEDQVK